MRFRLAAAIVLLGGSIGCGSGYSASAPSPVSSPPPSGSGAPVSIVGGADARTTNAYSPNPIVVSVGGTVTWTNNDRVAHTSTANDASWNSGSIAPGASFSRTFASAGSFPYHCTIHPGMVGTVTVQ